MANQAYVEYRAAWEEYHAATLFGTDKRLAKAGRNLKTAAQKLHDSYK